MNLAKLDVRILFLKRSSYFCALLYILLYERVSWKCRSGRIFWSYLAATSQMISAEIRMFEKTLSRLAALLCYLILQVINQSYRKIRFVFSMLILIRCLGMHSGIEVTRWRERRAQEPQGWFDGESGRVKLPCSNYRPEILIPLPDYPVGKLAVATTSETCPTSPRNVESSSRNADCCKLECTLEWTMIMKCVPKSSIFRDAFRKQCFIPSWFRLWLRVSQLLDLWYSTWHLNRFAVRSESAYFSSLAWSKAVCSGGLSRAVCLPSLTSQVFLNVASPRFSSPSFRSQQEICPGSTAKSSGSGFPSRSICIIVWFSSLCMCAILVKWSWWRWCGGDDDIERTYCPVKKYGCRSKGRCKVGEDDVDVVQITNERGLLSYRSSLTTEAIHTCGLPRVGQSAVVQ